MKTGAVAMIDALGFRGIWGRFPSEVVIANMSSLKMQLERDLKELSAQPIMQFDATFLSDTIVMGLSIPETHSNRDESRGYIRHRHPVADSGVVGKVINPSSVPRSRRVWRVRNSTAFHCREGH